MRKLIPIRNYKMLQLALFVLALLMSNVECSTSTNACFFHMKRGSCEYYKCFNEKYQYCNKDYGFEYCDRFDHHYESMSRKGKKWLNISRICAMEQMWEIDLLSCESVASKLLDIHKNCEVEAGICSNILWSDRSTFLDVSNLRSGTLYYKHSLKRCPGDVIKRFLVWLKENGVQWIHTIKEGIVNVVVGILDYFG